MKNFGVVGIVVLSLVASSQVLAEDSKPADERLGAFSMNDESMLGRYGDVNDEWVQSSSVAVSPQPAEKSMTPKKSVGQLGGFSSEDQAMLGRYGDHNDE